MKCEATLQVSINASGSLVCNKRIISVFGVYCILNFSVRCDVGVCAGGVGEGGGLTGIPAVPLAFRRIH